MSVPASATEASAAAEPTPDEPATSRGGPTFFGTAQPAVADLALGVTVVVLLIVYLPGLDGAGATLRPLLVLPLGAVGLVAMGLLAHRGDRAAIAGLAYLAWAGLSTLLAPQPRLAFHLGYAGDRGWVFLAAFLGCWAVGRWRGRRAEPLVTAGLLLGLGLNVAVALRQAVSDGPGLLGLSEGRAIGFVLSPVYLGAIMSGGLVLAAAYLGRASRSWWRWLPAAVAFAMTVNLAGSRIGLVGAAVLGVAAVRRGGWRRTSAFVAATLVGAVLAAALLNSSGTARVVGDEGGRGFEARALMWRAGVDAIAERPLVGWGPGRFREATSGAADLRFVRAEGVDRIFFDAHNLVVEQMVAVGVPGAILLAAFAWAAARRARGPLAWFAAGIAVTWLLQPTTITTAPVALLALGIAGGPPEPEPPPAAPTRRALLWGVSVLLAAVAFSAAARDVYVARLVERSKSADRPAEVLRTAVELRPNDPWVADLYAQARIYTAFDDRTEENLEAAVAATQRAVALEPTYPVLWARLGDVQVLFGPKGPEGWALAREAYEEALRLTPWHTPALNGLFNVALWEQRPDDARDLFVALCTIDRCPIGGPPLNFQR
jgi:O-antigen ligase